MKLSNVCMECHSEPEEFESSTGEKAYWMVTLKDDYSPIVIMSNLEHKFVVGLEKNYIAQDGEVFTCIKCYDRIHNSDEE